MQHSKKEVKMLNPADQWAQYGLIRPVEKKVQTHLPQISGLNPTWLCHPKLFILYSRLTDYIRASLVMDNVYSGTKSVCFCIFSVFIHQY